MSISVDELVRQARQLSPEELAALSGRVFELLCPQDSGWETAWTSECEDRIAACERGEMATYDSAEVMEKLRNKYALK